MTSPADNPSTASPAAEELLEHIDWIRGLARQLVRDPGAADDVAQETWLAAVRGREPRTERVRAWLAQIVRNRARHAVRTNDRRTIRERARAREEALPSTLELVDLAHRQRDVVAHVLALEEPFRTTVLLRYFEDLSPPQIAERLGAPLKTIHSRLARAHERLRQRLDQGAGGREAWLAALTPIARLRSSTEVIASTKITTLSGALMTTNAKWILVAGSLVLCGLGFWRATATSKGGMEDTSVDGRQAVAGSGAGSSGASRLATTSDAGSAPARRANAPTDAAGPGGASPSGGQLHAAQPTRRIRGRAVDLRGEPLIDLGVRVDYDGETQRSTTASKGEFTFELPSSGESDPAAAGRGLGMPTVTIDEGGWITLRSARVSVTSDQMEHLVVAARTKVLEGFVVDSAGAAIEGGQVSLASRSDAYFEFPFPLDLTSKEELTARTDSGGRSLSIRSPMFAVRGCACPPTATVRRSSRSTKKCGPTRSSLHRPDESTDRIAVGRRRWAGWSSDRRRRGPDRRQDDHHRSRRVVPPAVRKS